MRTTDGQRGPEIWIRGPVPAPESATSTPQAPGPYPPSAATPRRFSWLGTHGGAGVSTLCAVYGGHDCGRDWPGPGDPPSVLLVARTHATGLESVLRTLDVFRRGEAPQGLDLNAIVLVADAPGRLPRQLVQRVRFIESVIDVYRVPWVQDWRLGDLGGGPPKETETLTRLTGAAVGGRVR
ncbi:hypothetical protein OG562_25445 [Streptomyces sp. NBC_01275]|uniref:DUF6668 family protein n=1 Tax=Streptomyces sp. NBC_01275 TaxID=2903807 RepID=UPI0022540A6D|nr:DUF6668 family protein [Streptomyces sp. NBC_01275]MCX4764245.1 hypothetical protein [Streptomyces sp. NBC_01275]